MNATEMQPTSLKALSIAILERNRQCNRSATKPENGATFSPVNGALKLQIFSAIKSTLICFSCRGKDFGVVGYDVVCRKCHPDAGANHNPR